MKASEFIGKTVIDKEGLEIGKIEDLVIKPKKCLIDRVIISTGGAIRKSYFSIDESDIQNIGDYILLNLDKKAAEKKFGTEDLGEIKKFEVNYHKFIGKTVIAKKGVEAGRVEDLIIEPKECLINNVVVKGTSKFKKRNFTVGEGEITDIGDYVLLNIEPSDILARIV
ncbi:MAG: PRC-barrel domain-containing protein [Methanomicrobiales archaeon]